MADVAGNALQLTGQIKKESAAAEQFRGTANRGIPLKQGNPGKIVGYESIGGTRYARYRAEPGTWVSSSLVEQGYDKKYGRETGYGAYANVGRDPRGKPLKSPDRIKPGQEYLIPTDASDSAAKQSQPVASAPVQASGQRGLQGRGVDRNARSTDGRLGARPSVPPDQGRRQPPSPARQDAADTSTEWPFRVAAPTEVVKNYVDNRVNRLSINAVLGVVQFGLDDGRIISLPLAAFRNESYNLVPLLPVTPTKARALEQMERYIPSADLSRMGLTACAFYRSDSDVVVPTILNAQTLPHIWQTFREALILEGQRVSGWADAFEKVLQWYSVARIPIPALKVGSAGFVAGSMANELYQSTAAATHPGQRMLRAASILSDMRGLTAAQKLEVMQAFFKRIGFLAKEITEEKTFIQLIANDGKSALKILKDTGQILYGKFNFETLQYDFQAIR